MSYLVTIDQFEGPLDLLLHLLKQSDLDIYEIKIEDITKQYLNYIETMEKMDLNVASEYLSMAAELIEMKSSMLLPRPKMETDDEYEEDPRETLIKRLLEYKQYKEVTEQFKNLEEIRREIHTKSPSNISEYQESSDVNLNDLSLDVLMSAFRKFLERKALEKPLNTTVTKKEYSVNKRNQEIRTLLKSKPKLYFTELFETIQKDYVVVTFLSILELAKKQELLIKQEENFDDILLLAKGSENSE